MWKNITFLNKIWSKQAVSLMLHDKILSATLNYSWIFNLPGNKYFTVEVKENFSSSCQNTKVFTVESYNTSNLWFFIGSPADFKDQYCCSLPRPRMPNALVTIRLATAQSVLGRSFTGWINSLGRQTKKTKIKQSTVTFWTKRCRSNPELYLPDWWLCF